MLEALDVLIVDDDRRTAEHLAKYLKKQEDIHQVDQVQSAEEALEMIRLVLYDVVVLDLVMPSCDGFGFLERMAGMREVTHPDAIVVSAINSEDVIRKSFTLGAKYYMIKPFAEEIMYRRIWDVVRLKQPIENGGGAVLVKDNADILQRITDLFLVIGVPPHLKGYQYLKEAVRLAVEDRMIVYSITKKLYPEVARAFDVTSTKVELAIRHTIEVMWERGNMEDIDKALGFRVNCNGHKPTNGEFIALLADKLLSQGA